MKPRYLRPATDIPQVYLYRDAVDFRKQSAGLAAIVELELDHNPLMVVCMCLPIEPAIRLSV